MGATYLHAGIDEAGLGPTLGPLMIGAIVIRIERGNEPLDARLRPVIGPPQVQAEHLEVGDSKAIHTGPRKLARLERTVLATLTWLHGDFPRTTRELLTKAACLAPEQPALPWYPHAQEFADTSLPLAAPCDDILQHGERLRAHARARGVTIVDYKARLISENQLNCETQREAEAGGSKNTWSTHHSLDHALQTLANARATWPHLPLTLSFDRAGGRADYRQAIERALAANAWRLAIQREQREGGLSHYRLRHPPALPQPALTESSLSDHVLAQSMTRHARHPAVDVAFRVGAENVDLTVGWASLLAKYLREVTMHAFNHYWRKHLPDVRPTAGYPEDARRFIEDVDKHQVCAWPRSHWIRDR